MIKLNKTIIGRGDVKGVIFTQIKETPLGYIYLRSDGIYEVFKKQVLKQRTLFFNDKPVIFEEKEVYPKSKNFGISAWSCLTYEKALNRLKEFQN